MKQKEQDKSSDEKNKQNKRTYLFNDRVKQDNTNLANMEYNGTQTIEINDNNQRFEDDLSWPIKIGKIRGP